MVEHPDYVNALQDPWKFTHRQRLTQDDRKKHYVQSRHWSLREDNKHYYINDAENPYKEIRRFDWIRGDIVGGRSILWSRACYRWSDLDFEANAKEGIGIDWPIRYKDIAPWYDHAESFVGVSGNRDHIPQLPDGIYQPPFEMNKVEKHFKEQVEKRFPERNVIMGRTANLTSPLNGRGTCQSRDLCHRGCPYGAYFCTQTATLPAARATGNLTLRPHSLVNQILYDPKKGKAIGVELIDTQTRELLQFNASLIFVNASTVATGYILLNSTSSRFPDGLGNDSGQLGKNLMDHHKGLSAVARIEGFEDWYYRGRRPTPIYVPRFRNVKKTDSSFLRGYHFGGSAYRARKSSDHALGTLIKEDMTVPGPWEISLYAFGECLPNEKNRILLDRNKKDAWGRPLLQVDCGFGENERKMNADMSVTAAELLESAGGKDIVVRNTMSFPGNANHEMGVARMGNDPKTSVLNKFNQLHAVPNVFVTDGACMASGSCVNPSLTYMALTARACDYAVRQMKRREL
jgi:choline dehydrogenase-like flavoprotein